MKGEYFSGLNAKGICSLTCKVNIEISPISKFVVFIFSESV